MNSDGLVLSSSLLISLRDLISLPELSPHLLAPRPALLTQACQSGRSGKEVPRFLWRMEKVSAGAPGGELPISPRPPSLAPPLSSDLVPDPTLLMMSATSEG